jgi:hypothetical protein
MRKPNVAPGQVFKESDDPRETWRVEKVLTDGLHVSVVDAMRPSRRKTFSVWTLANRRFFTPAPEMSS